MSNITYRNTVTVFLNNKVVGLICEVKRNDGVVVWQYFPKSNPKNGGEQFATLELCKRSLEG